MIDIFKQTRLERNDFLYNEIEVVPGYTFSQYKAIQKIHLYRSSHFVDGDYYTVNGVLKKKIFDNICTWRAEVATKMLDIDTKDFVLVGNQEGQDLNVYLLEKDLKLFLKRSKFGKILNQVSEELPIYGSVVIEKTKNGARIVDLRYLYNDQGAENLKDGRYTIIKDYLTPAELRKMEGTWDNVSALLTAGYKEEFKGVVPGYDKGAGGSSITTQNVSTPLFPIFTRYGEVPLSWITGNDKDSEKYVLAKFVTADIDNFTTNDAGVVTAENGVVLYKEQIKELPLKECHYTRIKGRWLGEGVIEKVFEPQRRINEIRNQEARAMELASLILLQTQDQTVMSNLSTDVENGQILTPSSPISAVPTEWRSMPGFKDAASRLEQSADRATFSYDVVRGESSAASATLGSIQIQEQQAASAFSYKRENVSLFYEEFFRDIVIPDQATKLNKKHVLRLIGSVTELDNARRIYAQNWAKDQQYEMVANGKVPPPLEELKNIALETQKTVGAKMWVEVAEDSYRELIQNPDWYVDLVISGENKSTSTQLTNAMGLLDKIAAAPQILTNPVTRRLLFKALSAMGFHISELVETENEISAMPPELLNPTGAETRLPTGGQQMGNVQ